MAHLTALSSASTRRLPRTSFTINPRAPHISPRLLRSPSQCRGIWGCSHQRSNHDRHRRHIRFILGRHQRVKLLHHPQRDQTVYRDHQSWWSPGPGWGWSSFKPRSPEFQRGNKTEDNFWEAHKSRAQQHLDWIKKEIDADPYAALFGRRLEPFRFGSAFKLENGFTSLCRSLLGLGRTSITGDTTTRKKADFNSAPSAKSQSEGAQWMQGQSSGLNGAGFEFDPISGRMVPRSKPVDVTGEGDVKQGYSTEMHDKEDKSDERLGYMSPVKEAETEPYDCSKPEIVDSSCHGDPSIPEASREPENVSTSIISPQYHTSVLKEAEGAPDSVPEQSEFSNEATRVEPSRIQDQVKVPTQRADSDGHSVMPHGGTVQASQSYKLEDVAASKQPFAKVHEQKDGLDRLGFLSRHDKAPPTSTYSGVTQEQDDDLGNLRASDIRAAYESKRLRLKSEAEPETHKDLGEFSRPSPENVVDIDSYSSSQSRVDKNEDTSNPPVEPFTSTVSSQLCEEGAIGNQSHYEESTSTPAVDSPAAEVYRVFAYDPSSLQVIEAETISSLQSSREHLHPTNVLTRLTNPAKFLPCLNKMHHEGYEIVSGGENILVFRKAPKTGKQAANRTQEVNEGRSIREVYPSQTATTQPPGHGGFYTGNSPYPSSADISYRKTLPKSKAGRVLRRMLISGAATAGTYYALVVVGEYFRTGGEDGWGIDGFTEFESERRHRDR